MFCFAMELSIHLFPKKNRERKKKIPVILFIEVDVNKIYVNLSLGWCPLNKWKSIQSKSL